MPHAMDSITLNFTHATHWVCDGTQKPEDLTNSIVRRGENFFSIEVAGNTKTTPYWGALEDAGFRMSHQKGNSYFFYSLTASYTQELQKDLAEAELKNLSHYLRRLEPPISSFSGTAPAWKLLMPKRFDIAIKALYARLRLRNVAQVWREYVYQCHLAKITGGPFPKEHDGSNKEGAKAFINTFDSLLFTDTPDRIPPVPVDRHSIAFDGAHRIAAALACGREIDYVRLDADSLTNANSNFFSSPPNEQFPAEILDAAALEYCRYKRGLAIALLFPTVKDTAPALRLLEETGEIVHVKSIYLSPAAGNRLLRQVYLGHAWFHAEANSDGFKNKIQSCFPYPGEVTAILLDNFHPGSLRRTKEKIRDIYGLGNHSIHVTDSDEEMLRIARVLFNDISLLFLYGKTDYEEVLYSMLQAYHAWVQSSGHDEESFCLDGSIVLGLLGMRPPRDIDFLWAGDNDAPGAPPKGIDCHNAEAKFFPYPVRDIVFSPPLHGWYMGVKFCSPEVLLSMKRARGERKDKSDAAWLQSFLSKHGRSTKHLLRARLWLAYMRVCVAMFKAKNAIKTPLRPLVRKLRTFLQ